MTKTIDSAALDAVSGGIATSGPGGPLIVHAPNPYRIPQNWHAEKNGFWVTNSNNSLAYPTKLFWEVVDRNNRMARMRGRRF